MSPQEHQEFQRPRGRAYVVGLLAHCPELEHGGPAADLAEEPRVAAIRVRLHPEDRALLDDIQPAEVEIARRRIAERFEEIYPAGV